MTLSSGASFRAPELGAPREIPTAAGPLRVFERGEGRPIVFAHGWLTNANLWRGVVAALAPGHRTVVLDLPLGGHTLPMRPGADLTPAGVAGLILQALEALAVEGALLVGNDSGGAYSQIALARDATRAAGLALNACEVPGTPWPPAPFDPLQAAARAGMLRAGLTPLRDPALRMSDAAFGLLAASRLSREDGDSYVLPCLEDDGVLADAQAAIAACSAAPVEVAAATLIAGFHKPVALIWPADDQVFPHAAARAYAQALPDGRYEQIDAARSFTPQDQPAALAARLAAFAATLS